MSCTDGRIIESIITAVKAHLPSTTRILHSPIPLIAFPSAPGKQRPLQEPLEENSEDGAKKSDVDATPETSVILYIGGESLTLTNLLLTHASYEVS